MPFVSGEDLSAAKLNAAVGAAWVNYTPVWSATTSPPSVGNGSLVGRWTKIGSTVHVRINLIFGSTTNIGSGVYDFSLPETAAAAAGGVASAGGPIWVGSAYALDAGTADRAGVTRIMSSATTMRVGTEVGGQPWGHNFPLTWAVNDIISLCATYEGQAF